MLTKPEIIAHLKEAAKLVDASWMKGEFHQESKSSKTGWTVCAVGALQMAKNQNLRYGAKAWQELPWADQQQLETALMKALKDHPDAPWGSIPEFNDHRKTRKADIQKLFKRAICLLEQDVKSAASKRAGSSPSPVKRAKKKAATQPSA